MVTLSAMFHTLRRTSGGRFSRLSRAVGVGVDMQLFKVMPLCSLPSGLDKAAGESEEAISDIVGTAMLV